MRIYLSILFLCFSLNLLANASEPSIIGKWQGVYDCGAGETLLILIIEQNGNEATAVFNFEGITVVIPVILTPHSGHIDPPEVLVSKNEDG